MIAITDHNASANVASVQAAASGRGLVVLPGMEVQTKEDVHILCIFDSLEQITAWQQIVDNHLPDRHHRSDYLGDQLVVNSNGDFIRREERLLSTSTSLSIEEVWWNVDRLGGLVIPAHVDRNPNGLIPTIGGIPATIPFPALEISRQLNPFLAPRMIPDLDLYPLLQGGDAHRLDDIFGANQFILASPCIADIKKALRREESHSFQLLSSDSVSFTD